MGRLNKRALLVHLHRMGAASRADLAKSLGLSQPTAGKIVDELLTLGVFEEFAGLADGAENVRTRPRVGRPGRLLRLNRSTPRFLGVQLGIHETSLARMPVGVNGEDVWDARVKTPETARDWVRQLRKAAGKISEETFWGTIVSVPGLVHERQAEVLYSPNLHWTEKESLPALIREIWPAPVVLVQEEHALALGQQAADPYGEDFLLVDFGDGVGGAAVIGGTLVSHPLPIGCELGHTPIVGNSRKCGCGAVGCLETLTSVRGLLQSFSETHPKETRSWATLKNSIAERGIESWLGAALDATASVIAGALNVLGVRRVVITGTLRELPRSVFDHLSQAISRGALWARFGEIQIESAPRHRVAGLVAAGLDRLVLADTESASAENHSHPVRERRQKFAQA